MLCAAVCFWFALPPLELGLGATRAQPRALGATRAQPRALGTSHAADAFARAFGASVAHAQTAEEPFVFEVPPAPEQAEAQFTFDVHTGFSAPLNNGSLCPAGAGCVMRSGGGVGGSAELRWPVGLGLLIGYDLWFLDTDSVYELGVQQILRLGARYTMPTSVVFHPVFELSGGGMIYGDTFQAATVGGVVEVMAGSEFELSAAFGLRAGLGVRVFSHSEFTTERDGVMRGTDGRVSESIFLQVGLTFQ